MTDTSNTTEAASVDDATPAKSIKEVAKRIGVSDKSINNWLDAGAPPKVKGKGYDVAAIRKWREDNLKPPRNVEPKDPSLAESKAREAAARAEHWEQRVALAKGKLVEAVEVRAAVVEYYSFARSLIADLPAKLLSRVELKSGSKAQAMELLRDVCDTFLTAMSEAIRAVDRTAEESAARHATATAGRKAKTRQQR